MELRDQSLVQLRERLRACTGADPALLRALQRDPRTGAQALARSFERMWQRDAAERVRLWRMFRFERVLRARGHGLIAGVDEVGVGPLAGPVVAAAVILPEGVQLARLDDSKRLARAVRERLEGEIREVAVAVALGWSPHAEVDRVNVFRASRLAMRRALDRLPVRPDFALLDGRAGTDLGLPARFVIGGDRRSASVAAASIVAKVCRDRRMRDLDRRYPGYGFETNAGYGTAAHLRALNERGPTPHHRRSFAPVRRALEGHGRRCRTS